MLPFLKPKIASTTVVGPASEMKKEDEMDHGLMSASEDIIKAIHAKDATQLGVALKAAFDMLDSAPHVEGPAMDGAE